jgi:hypothetical protein
MFISPRTVEIRQNYRISALPDGSGLVYIPQRNMARWGHDDEW